MQILEILAIANLIALVVLPLRKSIWSFLCRTITCIHIYDWLKSEKKELEDPKENEYFVLCCKADKEFLKNITKEKEKKKFYRITVSPHDERAQEKIKKDYKVDISITTIDS